MISASCSAVASGGNTRSSGAAHLRDEMDFVSFGCRLGIGVTSHRVLVWSINNVAQLIYMQWINWCLLSLI